MKETRQRRIDAGLIEVKIWVNNDPKSISEAKALDKRGLVKQRKIKGVAQIQHCVTITTLN